VERKIWILFVSRVAAEDGRTDGQRDQSLMQPSARRPHNSVYRRSDGAVCWSH